MIKTSRPRETPISFGGKNFGGGGGSGSRRASRPDTVQSAGIGGGTVKASSSARRFYTNTPDSYGYGGVRGRNWVG